MIDLSLDLSYGLTLDWSACLEHLGMLADEDLERYDARLHCEDKCDRCDRRNNSGGEKELKPDEVVKWVFAFRDFADQSHRHCTPSLRQEEVMASYHVWFARDCNDETVSSARQSLFPCHSPLARRAHRVVLRIADEQGFWTDQSYGNLLMDQMVD